MDIIFDERTIYWLLIAVGGFFILFQFKIMYRPRMKGEIIEFQSFAAEDCTSCKSTAKGRASVEAMVLTDHGDILTAEVSPCMICMNKLEPGSLVGLTKIGSRVIAQPLISIRRKPRLGVMRSH